MALNLGSRSGLCFMKILFQIYVVFFRTLVTFERFLDFSMNINFDFKLKPEEDFVHHSFCDLTISMRIFQDFPFNFQNKCFCFSVLLPLFFGSKLTFTIDFSLKNFRDLSAPGFLTSHVSNAVQSKSGYNETCIYSSERFVVV